MTSKEIDKLIETKVYGNMNIYDVRREFQIVEYDMTLEAARALVDFHPDNEKRYYSITTTKDIPSYSEDIRLAMQLANTLIVKSGKEDNMGFMLSYFPDEGWRATFGNLEDCVEAWDRSHAAKAICTAALRYLGFLDERISETEYSGFGG